jgi:cytochrome c-type biogenesis protein CcmE
MAELSAKARRGFGIALIGAVLALAAALILSALEDSVVYFYGPTDLLAKPVDDRRIRVGGLVVEGSVNIDGIDARFDVSDGNNEVTIAYAGALPDLFREGQGIIAEGVYDGHSFNADTVLAKHDETYMPKEVADALKEQGVWQGEGATQ